MPQANNDIEKLANLDVDKYVRKALGAAEENVKIKVVIPLLNLLGYNTEKDMDFEHHVQKKKADILYDASLRDTSVSDPGVRFTRKRWSE